MIEAVEYMAETGKCENICCVNCPDYDKYNDCINSGWSSHDDTFVYDKTLQSSAKNWLKENELD